jgi:predicted regulator of Ras-like GTPase activity (Roadblock/LC7/MglB family)
MMATKQTDKAKDNGVVTFLAAFPDIKSAIIVGQDGMQIKLEIPESEMPNAVKLLALRDVVLRVTVEVAKDA